MVASPSEIRRLAGRLRGVAGEIRDELSGLGRQVADVTWRGLAADAMRALASERLRSLSRAAEQYDDAAAALEKHADSVERHRQLLADAMRRIEELF